MQQLVMSVLKAFAVEEKTGVDHAMKITAGRLSQPDRLWKQGLS